METLIAHGIPRVVCAAGRPQRFPLRRPVPGARAHLDGPHPPRTGRRLYGAGRRARNGKAAGLCGGAGPGLAQLVRGVVDRLRDECACARIGGANSAGRNWTRPGISCRRIRDQAGMISRLVDFSARIREPNDAAHLVAQALHAMASGRRGPAVLECAMDVWGRRAPVSTCAAATPVPAAPIDHAAIEQTAQTAFGCQEAADRRRRRCAGRVLSK